MHNKPNGSSWSMGPAGAGRVFNISVERNILRYKYYIGDGDIIYFNKYEVS